MIILDTEYTTWPGALESGWSQPGWHREIIQIAAISVDENFVEQAHFDILVRPSINPILSDLCIGLTGITQEMVDKAGSFGMALYAFVLFCGNGGNDRPPIICMNGDEGVFRENCRLNNMRYSLAPYHAHFHRLRPFLEECGIDLTNLSSGDLHTLTGKPLEGHTHNALHDVRSMARWLEWAKLQGKFEHLNQLVTGAPERDPRSTGGVSG